MNINYDPAGRQPKGPVAQVLTAIVGVLVLAGALMFSLVFFAVIAVAGLVLWLWFWWKTRALRRAMQEQMRTQGMEPVHLGPVATRAMIDDEIGRYRALAHRAKIVVD